MFYASGVFFVISFSWNLSISSTDIKVGLKKSFSNSKALNIFNSKRLLFTFIFLFSVCCLSILSLNFHFYNFDISNDSFLHILWEKLFTNLWKNVFNFYKKNYSAAKYYQKKLKRLKKMQNVSRSFWRREKQKATIW